MAAVPSLNVASLLREHLESASPDLLRAMVKTFADVLMSAEVDAVCGAEYGERSDERTRPASGSRGPRAVADSRRSRTSPSCSSGVSPPSRGRRRIKPA